jgi:hypothetical protein
VELACEWEVYKRSLWARLLDKYRAAEAGGAMPSEG